MDNFLKQFMNFCVSVEEMKRIEAKFNGEESPVRIEDKGQEGRGWQTNDRQTNWRQII